MTCDAMSFGLKHVRHCLIKKRKPAFWAIHDPQTTNMSSKSFFGFLPSGFPIYLLGTAFLGLGVSGLAQPESQYPTFGIPLPALPPTPPDVATDEQTDRRAAASPFVKAKSIRDLSYGLFLISLQFQGQNKAVNTLLANMVIVGAVDGAIVWVFGGADRGEKAWGHWGGSIALAAWTLTRIMGW